MEEKYSLENTTEHLKKYAEAKYNLIRLEMSEKLVSTVSAVSSIIVVSFLSIFILLFLSIGVALWINHESNHASMGFLVVAGFYLLMVIIVLLLKEKLIESPLIKLLLKKLYHEN